MNSHKLTRRRLRKFGGAGTRGSLASWKTYGASEFISSARPDRRLEAVFDSLIKAAGLTSYQLVIRCVRYRGRMETFTLTARGLTSVFSTISPVRNVEKLVRTVKLAVENYNRLIAELQRSEGLGDTEVSGLLAALQEVMASREQELAAIGISVDPAGGALELDAAKLTVAAGNNYRKVRAVLAGGEGLGAALSGVIRPVVSELAGEYLLASRFDQVLVAAGQSPYFATFSSGLFYDLLI